MNPKENFKALDPRRITTVGFASGTLMICSAYLAGTRLCWGMSPQHQACFARYTMDWCEVTHGMLTPLPMACWEMALWIGFGQHEEVIGSLKISGQFFLVLKRDRMSVGNKGRWSSACFWHKQPSCGIYSPCWGSEWGEMQSRGPCKHPAVDNHP